MMGDYNLFFDSKLDVQDGNSTVKKKFVAKLIEPKEPYDLCNIWGVKNTKLKRFTFEQEHSSGFIQRRLDYMFISKTFQEFEIMTDTPISTDHFPAHFSLAKEKGKN